MGKRAVYRQTALGLCAVVAIGLVLLQLADLRISAVNAGLVDVLLVLMVGSAFGIWAGLLVATLAAVIFNYFFLDPIFGFGLSNLQHIAAVPVLYLAAIIGASLQEGEPDRQTGRVWQSETAVALEPLLESMPLEQVELGLSLDLLNYRIFLDGSEVHLTPTEFSLLQLFVSNPDRILTRETILSSVWGQEYVADVRILRTYINQLRTKLHDHASAPRFIRTEPGFGYRFVGPKS